MLYLATAVATTVATTPVDGNTALLLLSACGLFLLGLATWHDRRRPDPPHRQSRR